MPPVFSALTSVPNVGGIAVFGEPIRRFAPPSLEGRKYKMALGSSQIGNRL